MVNDYTGPDRRRSVVLDAEAKEMITEMHILLTDKDMGVCARLKKHDETIFGNGKMGLKTQVLIMWIALIILGADSPLLDKVAKWIK